MQYKSILTYLDDEQEGGLRLDLACALTRAYDGHLSVLALGYEPDFPAYGYPEVTTGITQEMYERAQKQSEERSVAAKDRIRRAGINGDAEPLVCSFPRLAANFGSRARFADLVVLDQPYGKSQEESAVNLLEGALFDGDAAVLLSPNAPTPGGLTSQVGPKVVIGWNGSREALRAVRRSMPLLERASAVSIAVIDPETPEKTPAGDLAVFLARQGLEVEVNALPLEGRSVSKTLLAHLQQVGADLLVMGAYSHSRFREYVLGGVTRDILHNVPCPVLMAH
ncbi:MAG: universal stress protein [Neomegalonema sp.]|nr:universal stress protein [Neomegalonema sp.]